MTSSCAQVNHGKSISSVADQKLKESILEKWEMVWSHCEQKWLYFSVITLRLICRYMLVDNEDDNKTHRPVAPKDVSPVSPLPQLYPTPLVFHHFLLFLRLQRSSLDTTATRWWPPKGSAISLWRRTRRRRWGRRTSTWNPRGSTAFIDEEHKHGRAAIVGIVYTKVYLSAFILKLTVFVPRERFVSV